MSFFLGNIQKQAKNIKKDKNTLNPNKLGIIFAGANDLVTLGYDDSKGVERAIQGMIKTIEILTDQIEKADANFLKNLLIIGLPNISETPRFANKSKKEKLKMEWACRQYNQKLQALTNQYQYINFDCCTIYKYTSIKYLDLNELKQKKAIVIIGEGKQRTIFFINDGELVTNQSDKVLKEIGVTLSQDESKLFSKDGEILRDETNENKLNEFVNKVSQKAKLNINIKMLGIEAILDEILQNPEVHGFTAGCAVYYLPKSQDEESDLSLLGKITAGSAVIVKKINNEFFSYIIKDGQLIEKESKPVLQKFELSKDTIEQLNDKIKKFPSECEIITLANKEDIHNLWVISIIKSIVEHYEQTFSKKITLTSIDDSVLGAIKKDYLNKNTIFWDDLHPARRLHELLALKITEYVRENYEIKNQSEFKDDTSIDEQPKLIPNSAEEAPGSLPSEHSLLKPG